MQTPHKENPRPAVTGTRANSEDIPANSKRLPPYAKRLKPSRLRTLWVCIGSDCWERANSLTWFPGAKVALPPGEEPSAFRWSFVTGFADTAIIVDGEQPGTEIITALVRELLIYVDSVLLLPFDRHAVRFAVSQARRAA